MIGGLQVANQRNTENTNMPTANNKMPVANKKMPVAKQPDAAERETLVLNADHLSLRAIGPWLADLATRFGFTETDIDLGAVELAVHEIAMNIVDHSLALTGGTYTLTSVRDADSLVIRTCDRGKQFTPAAYRSPQLDEPQVGGYGLYLSEQLTDSLRYQRHGQENRWELVFKTAPVQA